MEGQCDFCGNHGKLSSATIISREDFGKIKPQNSWLKRGQIAILYRCSKCKFWQIAKPVAPMLLLILSIWVFIFLDRFMWIPYAMVAMVLVYNPITKFASKIFQTKNITDIISEKQILDSNSNLPDEEKYYIENDGIKSIFLMFVTFLIPAIFMISFQVINSSKMEASFAKNKRLGVGYLGHQSDMITYDTKHYSFNLDVKLKISNRSQADTFFQYQTELYSNVNDSCYYFNDTYKPLVEIMQKVLDSVVCIPIMYDATDKINGRMLLSKYDYNAFGISKESVKNQLGIKDEEWKGYENLFALIEEFQTKGKCEFKEELLHVSNHIP